MINSQYLKMRTKRHEKALNWAIVFHTETNKSSKFSKVLEGICSTETNRASEEEKQRELFNSLEEVKEQFRESESHTPKQLDTIDDEIEERADLQDYEKWSLSKCKKILRTYPKCEKAYYRLGILSLNENPIKARACFKECQEIDPEFRPADIIELIGDSVFKNK